jgi:hypothetical protein
VETTDTLRGRIFAADFALVTLTLSFSFFFAGAASQRYGPGPVVQVLALVSLAWGALYLVLSRKIHGRGGLPSDGPFPPVSLPFEEPPLERWAE